MSIPRSSELEVAVVESAPVVDPKELEIAQLKEKLALLEAQLRLSEELKNSTAVVSVGNGTPINSIVPISNEMFDHVPEVHNSGGSAPSIQDASYCGSADLCLFSEGDDTAALIGDTVSQGALNSDFDDFTSPAEESLDESQIKSNKLMSPSSASKPRAFNSFFDDSTSSRYASLSSANYSQPPVPSGWILNKSKDSETIAPAKSDKPDKKRHGETGAKVATDPRSRKPIPAASSSSSSSAAPPPVSQPARKGARTMNAVSYEKFFGKVSEDDEEFKAAFRPPVNKGTGKRDDEDDDDEVKAVYPTSSIKHFLVPGSMPAFRPTQPAHSSYSSSSSSSSSFTSASAPPKGSVAAARAARAAWAAGSNANSSAGSVAGSVARTTAAARTTAVTKVVPEIAHNTTSTTSSSSSLTSPAKRVSKPIARFSPVHDPLNSKTYSMAPPNATSTSISSSVQPEKSAGISEDKKRRLSAASQESLSKINKISVDASPSKSASKSVPVTASPPVSQSKSKTKSSSSSSSSSSSIITGSSKSSSKKSRRAANVGKVLTGGPSGRVCDTKTVVQSGNAYKVVNEIYSCSTIWKSREKVTTVDWQRETTAKHCKDDSFRTIFYTNLNIIKFPTSTVDILMDSLLYMTRILDAHEPPMRVVDSSKLLQALIRLVLNTKSNVDVINQALTVIYYIANLSIGQEERVNEIVSADMIPRLSELVATADHYMTVESSICLLNCIARGPNCKDVFQINLQYPVMATVLKVVRPDSCIEVLYQGLKIIRTFCASEYFTINLTGLVLLLDLIHAALRSDDGDMFGFAAEAIISLIACETDKTRSNGQLNNLLSGLTEEEGLLETLVGILNDAKKLTAKKTRCVAIMVACLEAIAPSMYLKFLNAVKPLKGLVSCVHPLSYSGAASDLVYDACKCLSLLLPYTSNFRRYLDDEERFVKLMRNFCECAVSEDVQDFAKTILKEMGETVHETVRETVQETVHAVHSTSSVTSDSAFI